MKHPSMGRRPWGPTQLLRLWFAVLALSGFGGAVWAQQVPYRQFLQHDGLGSLVVPCLLQDRDKTLWVCTDNGLFKHDGVRFSRLGPESGLQHGRLSAIAQDAGGRIWVGTASELYVGRGDNTFSAVRAKSKPMPIGVGSQLSALPDGRMLVVSGQRLYRMLAAASGTGWQAEPFFTPQQLAADPQLDTVSAIHVDRTGTLWLGCGPHVCSVDTAGVRRWGLAEGVPAATWHAFLLDRRGRLWARSFGQLVHLAPDAPAFEASDEAQARLTTAAPFVSLVEDHEGRVVTRSDDGLLRWSPEPAPRGHWEAFGPHNGLPGAAVLSLLVDHEGSLWMGTGGNGLLRWRGYENWATWTTLQGLKSNVVWSVFRDADGRLLVGSNGGCSMLDESTRRFEDCPFVTAGSLRELNAMAQTGERDLWLTSMAGDLFRAAPGRQAQPFASLPYIRTAWRDKQGTLWLLTYKGVYRIEAAAPPPRQPEPARVPGAEQADFSDVAQDASDGMWLASTRGLFSHAQGRWLRAPVDDALSKVGFRSLAISPDGVLWAASVGQGVMRAELDGSVLRRWSWVTDPMVAGAAVTTVRVDPRGWVWLASDQGLMLFDGRQWRRFDQADGLAWNDTNQTAWFFDTDGSIWIGTSAGLAHILHPQRLVRPELLDARIVHATAGTQRLDATQAQRVPWQRNLTLRAGFSMADFSETESAHYRYRLAGLESDWTETRVPEVRYSSLEPGDYRLDMIAVQKDHGRVSATVSLHMDVVPPWWRSVVFRLVMGGLGALGVWLLIRWRDRRLRRRQQRLELELREHEDLLRRATRDGLTGLWNRAAILDLLAREMLGAARRQSLLAIVMIDVDHFKRVNDQHGHLAGDAVLRALGTYLAQHVRATDHVGRYGGEELLLIMPGMAQTRPCEGVEKLQHGINDLDLDASVPGLRISASFGAAWQRGGESAEQLIARADAALYAAKVSGRDRVEYEAAADAPAASSGANLSGADLFDQRLDVVDRA